MIRYRVDGPERWKKSNTPTGKTIITCKICSKKLSLTASYRIWPEVSGSTYSWVCSDRCTNFFILRGEDEK